MCICTHATARVCARPYVCACVHAHISTCAYYSTVGVRGKLGLSSLLWSCGASGFDRRSYRHGSKHLYPLSRLLFLWMHIFDVHIGVPWTRRMGSEPGALLACAPFPALTFALLLTLAPQPALWHFRGAILLWPSVSSFIEEWPSLLEPCQPKESLKKLTYFSELFGAFV